MLVGGVVIDHQMYAQIGWYIGIHLLEKLEILLMAVTVLTAGEHLTSRDIQGSKKTWLPSSNRNSKTWD